MRFSFHTVSEKNILVIVTIQSMVNTFIDVILG